jgi:hypothetical protein
VKLEFIKDSRETLNWLILWGDSPDLASTFPWVVTNGIKAIAQPEIGGACTSPWGLPAGTLGPKKGWLWNPASPKFGNRYMLICIFAPFLTQHVLKSWWSWTYQNFAVKHASARIVLELVKNHAMQEKKIYVSMWVLLTCFVMLLHKIFLRFFNLEIW